MSNDFTINNKKKGTSFSSNLKVFSSVMVKRVCRTTDNGIAPGVCAVGDTVSKDRFVCNIRLNLSCGIGS